MRTTLLNNRDDEKRHGVLSGAYDAGWVGWNVSIDFVELSELLFGGK